MGLDRLDARARDTHAAVLVAGAELLHRPLWLVCGADSSDQVSHRDRLLAEHGGVGARLRQSRRHSRTNLARPSLGPDRPRMDLERGLLRLRDMLSVADRASAY